MKDIFDKSAGDCTFFLRDGQQLNTIKELYNSLDTMSDDIFLFHTEAEKNDFANWIGDVFNEMTLANELNGASNQMEAKEAIENWNLGENKSIVFKPITARDVVKESETKKEGKKIKKEKKEISLKVEDRKPANIEPDSGEEVSEGVDEHFNNNSTVKNYELYSKPTHFISGILDFIVGFIIGALSMVLFIRFG